MKKSLLLCAAVLTALMATAQNDPKVHPQATAAPGEDITPPAFRFHSYDGAFRGFYNHVKPTGSSDANWNLPNHFVLDNVVNGTLTYGDGLIVSMMGGPGNAEQGQNLQNATSVVDFGGTLGKCLVINFTSGDNDLNAKLNSLVDGANYNIAAGTVSMMPVLYWVPDPEKVINNVKGADHRNFRCRLTVNIYDQNGSAGDDSVQNFYANDDETNPRDGGNGAASVALKPVEFCYTWSEKDDTTPDDGAMYDGDNGEYTNGLWNPNRFLVYEFDFSVAAGEASKTAFNYFPRLKMEMKPAAGKAVIIRSMEIYVHDETDLVPALERRRTWQNYTYSAVSGTTPDPSGIDTVGVDAAGISVNGNAVTFADASEVYNIAGQRVANAAAGQTVTLDGGFYVVRTAAGKGAKFVLGR